MNLYTSEYIHASIILYYNDHLIEVKGPGHPNEYTPYWAEESRHL